MKIQFHAEKAFFKTDTIDPFTDLPVYVFDSNYLPKFDDLDLDRKTFESLIVKAFKKIISRIPKHPYVLTCFTSGFKNFNHTNNSWVTCLKCYQLLPDELKSYLMKVYVVHESWLVRSMIQVLQNVLRIGFFKTMTSNGEKYDRIIYCNDLTDLSKHIDITKIRISLDVYLYDSQFEEKLIIPYHTKHNSIDYIKYKEQIFERVSTRLLLESSDYELVFTKPGNQKKCSILSAAIERGNYLDVSQWDVYVMGSLYLGILRNEVSTLIPIDLIQLPISDDYNYTLKTFQKMIQQNNQFDVIAKFFEILINMLKHSHKTKHDVKTISKSITPTLCQEKVSLKNNDRIAIGQRFIKNLIQNWDSIMKDSCNSLSSNSFSFPSNTTKRSTTNSTTASKLIPETPPPRKVSFHKRVPSIQRIEPKALPDTPNPKRHASSSSMISIDTEFSSSSDDNLIVEAPIKKAIEIKPTLPTTDIDESKVLTDVTSSMNKRPIEPTILKKRQQNFKVISKFSDGYSSIEGQKKVNQLAKLYEERLMGLQIMKDIES